MRRTIEERFWSRVTPVGDCLIWTGSLTRGYGRMWNGIRVVYCHRYFYELRCGAVPGGMQLDHLCRNRACVSPAHLQVVTARENILRGNGMGARYAARTRCAYGHELDRPANPKGWRCPICWNLRHERQRESFVNRAAAAGERVETGPSSATTRGGPGTEER